MTYPSKSPLYALGSLLFEYFQLSTDGPIQHHLQKTMVSGKKACGWVTEKIGDHYLDLNRLSSLQRYFFFPKMKILRRDVFSEKTGLRTEY